MPVTNQSKTTSPERTASRNLPLCLIAIVFALLLACSAYGCSQSSSSNNSAGQSQTSETRGLTVNDSALSYVWKVLNNDNAVNTTELKNLAVALLRYNAAANAYFA